MAQFKCKLISNIRQDFPNHFMSLWSETRKRRQSKFSASTILAETRFYLALLLSCSLNVMLSFKKYLIHSLTKFWPCKLNLRNLYTIKRTTLIYLFFNTFQRIGLYPSIYSDISQFLLNQDNLFVYDLGISRAMFNQEV